jgi:hypothetical protein
MTRILLASITEAQRLAAHMVVTGVPFKFEGIFPETVQMGHWTIGFEIWTTKFDELNRWMLDQRIGARYAP